MPDDARSLAPERIPCVGAVITDEAGRILLILRGHEPGQGLWSIPGGRIEPGETDEQAVVRGCARDRPSTSRAEARLLGTLER